MAETKMGEESKPFTVTDRRKFTATGELRGGVSESAPESGAAASESAATPTEQEVVSPPSAPLDDAVEVRADEPGSLPDVDPGPPPRGEPGDLPDGFSDSVDLSSFMYSLAMQASQLLSSPGAEDLQGARHMISILEMLEKKTAGNRTEQEEGLLDKLLYEVRMAYVGRAQGTD